jgi:hypothetical protein
LPTGSQLRLLAVSSQEGNENLWWQPDGTPLANPPFKRYNRFSGGSGFDFAVQIPGVKASDLDAPTITMTNSSGVSLNDVSMLAMRDLNDAVLPDIWHIHVTGFARDMKSDTLRVGIADGAFKQAAGWMWSGSKPLSNADRDLTTWNSEAGVVATTPYQEGQFTVLDLTHTFVNDDVRGVIMDRNGKLHVPDQIHHGGEGKGISRRIYRFAKLPLKDVREFEFQRRPFNLWVEFANVSLAAGNRTKVTATIK